MSINRQNAANLTALPLFGFISFVAIQSEKKMVRKMEMARETEREGDGDRLLLVRSPERPSTRPSAWGRLGAAAHRYGVGHSGPIPPLLFSGTPHPAAGRPAAGTVPYSGVPMSFSDL